MQKELEGLGASKAKKNTTPSGQNSKMYQTGKRQAMDTGLNNSLLSITDWLLKWTDAYKKQIHPNGWPKERSPWSKMTPKKNHTEQLQTHNMLGGVMVIVIGYGHDDTSSNPGPG